MNVAKGVRILVLSALCLALAGAALAIPRPQTGPGRNNYVPHVGTSALQVQEANLDQLLQCLVGPGVTVSNAVLTAAPGAAGLFSGGAGIIGIDQGLVLSSGNIINIVGPNMLDDATYDNAYPGDPDLDALIPGYETFDATILEFDFTCDNPSTVSFQFVFGSEEYNEWVGSPYNDVFGFFLNGSNIAVVPASCSNPGIPVAVNNVDCGNPYAPPIGPNCDCYRNNALPEGGGLINTEMDGLTQVFYATANIHPGTNHMKLAIADAGDHILDSNVMISCQSFVCAAPPTIGACCVGDDCFLIGAQQCLSQGGLYAGDGRPCSPNPCEPVPVKKASWGGLKLIYR
jgi:hypothetical protein